MNRCKHCGKEIDDKHKFCNSSCAAKYNNARRERKPWTEEQRQKASDDACRRHGNLPYAERWHVCKCCGQKFQSNNRKHFCSECLKIDGLWDRLRILNHLGVWKQGKNIDEATREASQLLSKLYFEEKESLLSIAQRFHICKDTVKCYIGEKLRTRGEALQVAVETGRTDVPSSPRFKQGAHTSWEGHKFHFRSSWEERYMQELDEKKVPYLYEAFRIRYFDTQKNEERVAVPDFFLPDTNTIVELKSSYTYDEQNMKDRFKAYQERGYKTILLLDWQEQPLL